MVRILEVLRREHASMARLLNALERQVKAIEGGGEANFHIVASILDYYLSYPDLCHHPKEDMIFSKLKARVGGEPENIGDLLGEHERLGNLTRNFTSAATRQGIADANLPNTWFHSMARNFLDAQRKHMSLEEQLFFPEAENSLTEEDWADLDARVNDPDDPFFCDKVEQRFAALLQEVLEMESQTDEGT